MELMIAVALVGIIATFGIPNYTKMIRKTHERNAISGLISLHAANELYEAKNGQYLPGGPLDRLQINTNLSIDLKDLGMIHSYTRSAIDAYQATNAWTSGVNFTVRVDERPILLDKTDPAANPCCSTLGTCPTLPDCP